MIALLRSQRVDGILLVAAGGLKWSKGRAAEIAAGAPVVCLDRLPDGLDVDSVCVDDRSAAGIAVSHLLAMGHRKIAVLTGPPSLRNEQERLRGYRQALQKAGVPVRGALIWVGGFEPAEVFEAPARKACLKPAGQAFSAVRDQWSDRAGSAKEHLFVRTEHTA
jgi:LacI family transcriptional regulator